jgi:multidrug resistance efflux pump
MPIHSLRPQTRPDNAKNQIRAGQSFARRLYLIALVLGFGWIGYQFLGPLVVMDADGLVAQDREVVTPPYAASVVSLSVRPGQAVEAGQQIGVVVSMQMLDLISDLATRKAQADARDQEIAAKLSAIDLTLPAAQDRASVAAAASATVDKALAHGWSTTVRAAEAMRDRYEAEREAASLGAEKASLISERLALNENRARISSALDKAKRTYREGVIVSPVGGIVGARLVSPGTVLSPGNILGEVYHGEKYVLAYLPTNRYYPTEVGQPVVVADGGKREIGQLERIEVITDQTPPEFRSSLRGVDRQQVARISLPDGSLFPLLSKINVTATYAPSNLLANARQVAAASLSIAMGAVVEQAKQLRIAVVASKEDRAFQ